MAYKNKEDGNAHYRNKYRNDPEWRRKKLDSNREQGDKRSYENQTKAFELVGVFGCSNKDCQEDVKYYHQIDWHHQKPENKKIQMGWGFRYLKWEKIKKEIIDADVIPLCKVCHYREEMKKEYKGNTGPIPLNRGRS